MKYEDIRKSAEELADVVTNKIDINNAQNLSKWLQEKHAPNEIIDILTDENKLAEELGRFYRKDKFIQRKRLQNSIRKVKNRRLFIRYSVSAAVAIIAISTLVYIQYGEVDISKSQKYAEVSSNVEVDIEREYKSPTLISYNGEEVQLDSANNGKEIYVTSSFEKDRELSIKKELLYNTIVVPRSTDYTFILQDGTVVKLNAGSRLIYPVEFNDSCRFVKLDGEAYFEVIKDKREFVVEVGNFQVKVYGTKFNVNAYDKNSIKTFLVEGRVGVKSTQNNKEAILEPNHISVSSQNGDSKIYQDNANQHIAWTKGRFHFEEQNLKDVLTELERWYDVTFELNGNSELLDKKIVASFSRDININRILTMLNKVFGLKFTQKERRIIID